MSSAEDDDCMIKLDANIEVETIVRNRFEEDDDDTNFNDSSSNNHSASSDEDQPETSAESSQADTSIELKETDNTASVGSDVSDNFISAISDVSADSGDSMTIDAAIEDAVQENVAAAKEHAFYFENLLKDVNCKELIVFCIDMSSDMEKMPFVVTDEFDDKEYAHSKESPIVACSDDGHGSKNTKQVQLSPLSMVKRAIGMYVHNKHFIDRKHEYSLMVLYDSATWVCEFTNNPNKLVESLEDLTETLDCNCCDLSSIVSLLTEKYPFIISTDFKPAAVHRILRVILIYGRSNCMIEFSDPSIAHLDIKTLGASILEMDKDILLDYPSFFLDILYIHEPPSDENKCIKIYEALCSLDDRDKSYIFEMTRSVTKLHNCMGRLLSHPFQRAPQKNANYKLQDIVPPHS